MPASCVKPYVKRQKNDAKDAEAICEAVTRPTIAAQSAEPSHHELVAGVQKFYDGRQRVVPVATVAGHFFRPSDGLRRFRVTYSAHSLPLEVYCFTRTPAWDV